MTPNAYAFINIDNALAAWNIYRSVIVPPPNKGFKTIWATNHLLNHNDKAIMREMYLEGNRQAFHPDKVSRMEGFYCFEDKKYADAALAWGIRYFKEENLADLHIEDSAKKTVCDSNWITCADLDDNKMYKSADWFSSYWQGEPFPNREPIWETIVDGRVHVLTKKVCENAYKKVKRIFPESVYLLELARISAKMNSNAGLIYAYLQESGPDHVKLNCYMDTNWPFNISLDNEVHFDDVIPYECRIKNPRIPDFSRYDRIIPKKEAPYLKKGGE